MTGGRVKVWTMIALLIVCGLPILIAGRTPAKTVSIRDFP